MSTVAAVEILAPADESVLTTEALDLVARLQRELNPRRRELLEARRERQAELDEGALPQFLPATKGVRDADWRVAEAPAGLRDRRCEITGPVDRNARDHRHFGAVPAPPGARGARGLTGPGSGGSGAGARAARLP